MFIKGIDPELLFASGSANLQVSNKKKSIVFINQNAGYLMIDIINAHHSYSSRSIISGKITSRNKPVAQDVKWEKIISYNRSSSLKRIFTWGWGFLQILWLVKTKYRKSELFIVTNPPFAGLIPLFCKNKFSLLVYDIYPDALVAYKYLKGTALITRWWQKANRKIFSHAKNIFTISHGMQQVLSKYIPQERIKIVPIWADNEFLKPIEKKDNLFIKKYNLHGKFLVIYSGNLGVTHSIEVLISVAAAIKDRDIFFVIIGDGEKQQLIGSLIKKNQLDNCTLLPWQAIDMLPYSLSAADLSVVTLGKEASGLSIPSKIFSLMSVGSPVMCIADLESELGSLVNRYQIGASFLGTEIEKMIEFINDIKSNKDYHNQLQQNALAASKEFGPENAFKFVDT